MMFKILKSLWWILERYLKLTIPDQHKGVCSVWIKYWGHLYVRWAWLAWLILIKTQKMHFKWLHEKTIIYLSMSSLHYQWNWTLKGTFRYAATSHRLQIMHFVQDDWQIQILYLAIFHMIIWTRMYISFIINAALKGFTIIFQIYLTILVELFMKSLKMFYLSNLSRKP